MATSNLTVERLRELIHYNPETGVFTRLKSYAGHRSGEIAGNMDETNGYQRIRIDRVLYRAHRLAWFYMHGEWPQGFIDHINRIKLDNRMQNLRECTACGNNQNVIRPQLSSRSGFRGVTQTDRKNNPWRACITKDGKQIYLGSFSTAESAHEAYIEAKKHLHLFAHFDD